ncbi:DNA replication/repair protein RecF [Pseudobacteroides cellulosolvens]
MLLKNYRNYSFLEASFNNGFNIIYGNNAQGKTNILEAIYLCTTGRSHRTNKDNELVKYGEDKYFVKVLFSKEERNDNSIEINYSKKEKKSILINEIAIKKIGNLMGQLNSVMFSPEDLQIIKEGPSERRRFIDIALSQLKPSYFYNLQQYLRILNQRNYLLKEIYLRKESITTLDVWNQSLAETGSKIIAERIKFIKCLYKIAEKYHKNITNEKEKLEIKYISSIRIDPGRDDIKNIFLKRLEEEKSKEIQKGTTLVGPQRDDLDILINGTSLKQYGSQGQQRTAILSLKLSELEIVKESSGEYPILLLDDVMSELDSKRREYLIENIKNIQTFITCTDKNEFIKGIDKETCFIKIENGKIVNNINENEG